MERSRRTLKAIALLLTLLLPSCAGYERNSSAREWQLAECNRVIDAKARERCVERVESEYGRK